MGKIMGKLQEEQIQEQIRFYNQKTIQDMIDRYKNSKGKSMEFLGLFVL